MAVDTEAYHGALTKLGYKLASGDATYTDVGQIIDLDMGGTTIAKIETSKLSSLVKTSIPGTPDNGDVTFSVYYVPGDAGVAQLQTLSQTPAVILWQITLPDGSTSTTGTKLTFTGWLNSFAPTGFAQDTAPTAEVSVTITSLITVVAGS